MKKIFLVMGIVLISLLASSCSKEKTEDTLSENTISANERQEEPPIDEQEYEWTVKYNQYVDYSNWAGNTLRTNTISKYVSRFGSETAFTKPTFERDATLTALEEYNFKVTDRTIDSATNGLPLGEIDEAVLKNIEDTVTYMELWNEMADYYRNDKYKEDDYAKSQEYHEALFYCFFEMIDSYDIFAEYFEELVKESESKEVEALKERGFLTLAAAYSVLINYRDMLQLFPNEEDWIEDFFAVSLTDYERCYDQYVISMKDLETYLNDEKQNKKEGLTSMQIAQLTALVNVAGEMSIHYIEDIGKLLEAGSYDTDLHDPNLRNNTYYNPVETLGGLLNSIVNYYNSAIS